MKQTFIFIIILLAQCASYGQSKQEVCSQWPSLLKPSCENIYQIWTEGTNDIYYSGYAWHNRYTYSEERVRSYNEMAWGGGLGKGFYDKDNNNDWSGLYAFAFLDSHRNVEPIAGYGFLKTAQFKQNAEGGLGFTVFLTSRPDIFHSIPFPGILPMVSLRYRQVSISTTYIPGAFGVGNVLFCFGRIILEKT